MDVKQLNWKNGQIRGVDMDKHAYLVIAHDRFDQLALLLKMIDDSRNDIYLHIDARADFDPQLLNNSVKQSKLIYVNRRKVRWGSSDQVKTELDLLRSSVKAGGYKYYHLLSGHDLPIQTQDTIHAFFKEREGVNFVSFVPKISGDDMERVSLYHLCTGRRGRQSPFWENAKSIFDALICAIERKLRINRIDKTITICKGANWFSITGDLACDLVRHESEILDFCKYGFCCDEIFLQTYIWNSKWRSSVFHIAELETSSHEDISNSMRLIDWNRGKPYTWRIQDKTELRDSNMLFARKFDINIDEVIVHQIFEWYSHS